jgi:hypothetical protein
LKTGDTFKEQIVVAPTALPVIGAAAPGVAYTNNSDLTGVDTVNNKYVDIYEIDSTGKISAFKEVTLKVGDITAPSITVAPTAAPGTIAGSTSLTLTPNTIGDTFAISVVKSITKLPVYGLSPGGKTYPYTSGKDIATFDTTANNYVDVYEVNGTGNIIAFKELTLVASNITAPTLKVHSSPGLTAGSTKLSLTTLKAGDTFKEQIVVAPTALPVIGTLAPGASYTNESDITNVDTNTNKYVDLYEVDGSGKITAFKEVTLIVGNVTAPTMTTAPTVSPGATAESTKLALTPNTGGDTFAITVARTASKLPVYGVVPNKKTDPYISGNDIQEVDTATNKYVDVYELNSAGNVVAFVEVTLISSNITAPTLVAHVLPGATAGSTKLSLITYKTGDTFLEQTVSTPTTLPVVGASGVGAAYTNNTDITGVNITTNKYVDIYEIDNTGKITAFKEITLIASNITAPTLTSALVLVPGTVPGSTKLTLTPNNAGDTFTVIVGTSPLRIPILAINPHGVPYFSGTNIVGVDAVTHKYVDIYEIDNTGTVVAFKEIILLPSNITAPTLN